MAMPADKNQSEFIDMGNRKIKIYPDNPADICGYIEAVLPAFTESEQYTISNGGINYL
ncbi:MAG TPA: hypothetical protein PK733_13605 [Clostridiales bacterium]|nr:hypothetical protein [Clostridiales bacterium]